MSASNASRQSLATELPFRQRPLSQPSPFHGALRAVGVLAAVLLLSSEASADRISLMNFEGSNARSLRWRVAGALKRAGHKVVSPPKSDSPDKLRVFAKRRKVDLFIAGEATGGNDGWALTLKMLDADGAEVGDGVTFSAPSLRAMMKELKADGQSRIDDAIRGGGAPAPKAAKRAKIEKEPEEVEVDVDDEPAEAEPPPPPPPEADFAGNERSRGAAKKKKQAAFAFARSANESSDADSAAPSADAEEPRPARSKKKAAPAPALDIDADETSSETSSDEPENEAAEDSRPRTSKASSWSAGDDKPSESEPASDEDDGRAAFLSDSAAEGGEVGQDEGSSSSSDAGSSTDDPTVIMGLNAGFVRRTLSYSDDLYGRLRAPSANTWVYRLQAAVYPFAKPVKNRIGLIAGYESEFSGVVRDNAAGTDFGVNFSEVYGGLKLRQPLGVHELALEGTVGSMQTGLDDPDGNSGVPSISYTTLRAALDAGLHFGSLAMRGSLGYRLPIGGYGEASEVRWFPRMEASGIEGSLGLEYRITKEVAFDVSATMRRYLLQMNSRPEDAETGASEVAGGAVDLYLGGYFGLNITL
ncbi:MAG TPA: hypothetical protein VMG12_37070 [Polyangiaceae bacterium]|nr:hypothetical protein [Polyangiaceae bacterium]